MKLDTIWSILKNYVVSIPTAIIKNVGLQIDFSFKLTEGFAIYDDFFKVFMNVYRYPIPAQIMIIESDQGSALQTSVEEQVMEHICYLRHLLKSLGKTKFSSQIGNLVSAACDKDFDTIKQKYEKSWQYIADLEESLLLQYFPF